MASYRSQSCRDGRDVQVERDSASHDLPRSYSTTEGYKSNTNNLDLHMKKMKSSWSLDDPELQRKKRVAGYKVYAVEGKVKGSVRKSLRWIKDMVYGWR